MSSLGPIKRILSSKHIGMSTAILTGQAAHHPEITLMSNTAKASV